LRDVSCAIRVEDHAAFLRELSGCTKLRRLRLYENMLSEDMAAMEGVQDLLVEAGPDGIGIMEPS
jgi:hypothetical protein